jgi:hypothetical protein
MKKMIWRKIRIIWRKIINMNGLKENVNVCLDS